MSYVGVFLEKEITGELFRVFSYLSETDNSCSFSSPSLSGEEAAIGGGESDISLHTRFFCPKFRFIADYMLKENKFSSDNDDIVPVSISPHFNKETAVHVQFLLDEFEFMVKSYERTACKHPVLPLFWCNNEKPNTECGGCSRRDVGSGYYYACETCNDVFHKECVEAPVFLKHPSYPSLSLQLYPRSFSRISTEKHFCIFCETQIDREMTYYCPTYKEVSHMVCALKPIPIIVDHFKRHHHPLTLFPKQDFLACNICGVIKKLIPTFVCARCVFVVHQDCIYFPYVIRISRHHHRISFNCSLPSRELSCGVCRRNVDNSYGAYSCNIKCDDGYFVHSRCALRRDLWDGEELEGIPEEIEIVEDPFETIADGIILHFSHGHHLKLEICRVYDEDKYCQGCVLPIYEGSYYSCVDEHCDFILHETCANAPCKIRHPLHFRSLTLKLVTSEYKGSIGFFRCDACQRRCNGFVYEESTAFDCFRLDVRCASISEPFKYEGHEHPLFLALSPDEEWREKCHICHDHKRGLRKLNCIECDFIICFRCATLPYKAKYKHDKHFVTFRKELVETDQSNWCEACEKKIAYSRGEGGFYACDEECCTTLHVDCLLGKHPYMKHGQTVSRNGYKLHIIRNNTMSRPFCRCCRKRCPDRVVIQRRHFTWCSYSCTRPKYLGYFEHDQENDM